MSEEEKPQAKPKKRRRWKRWFLGVLVLLAGLLVWFNGPGLRWVLTKVINSQLEAQQLSGSFEVRGTALTGISLHDISLSGEGLIRKAESDLIAIDWSLTSLLNQRVEAVTLQRLDLIIDPVAAPPSKPSSEPDEASTPLAETLNLVRGYVQPTEISLTDLRIEVIEITAVTLASFTHESGSDQYQINELEGRDHLDRPIVNPATTLTWTEKGFEADQISLRPTLGLRNLVFHPGEQGALNLYLADRQLKITSDLKSSHQIVLLSPDLPIREILELAQPDLEVSGAITNLKMNSTGGVLDIAVENLAYQDQTIKKASLKANFPSFLDPFDKPAEISFALDEKLTLDGSITLKEEPLDSIADLNFTVNWPDFPAAEGEIAYDSREARVLARTLDSLLLTARYQVDSQSYGAEVVANIANPEVLHPSLLGPLEFTAKAKGNLDEATHSGSLDLAGLNLKQADFPTATTSGKIFWNWPESVTVENITTTTPDGRLQGSLVWKDNTLEIPGLDLIEEETKLLGIKAKVPASLEMKSLEDFLASKNPLSVKISSEPLSFKKLSGYIPLPPDLQGILQADLVLAGSPSEPSLDGFTTLDDFRLASQPDLPPVSVDLNFETNDQTLTLKATADEPGGPLLDLEGQLPFIPKAWLDRKADPANAPLSLTARTPVIDLRRIEPFVPAIKRLDGSLEVNVEVSGTVSDPELSGFADASIKTLRLEDSPFSDFKNSAFRARFAKKTVTIEPSIINLSGGTANLRGTVDLNNPDPVFDLRIGGKYLLLYRTPDFSLRSNADLRLAGPFSAATISGDLRIVESLIYKDIEILPFGVPRTTEIPQPSLPSFSAKATTSSKPSAPTPSGPMDWELDINVSTQDAILIRGNLVEGQITGQFKVGGTVGDPTTNGKLTTQELVADLPFSKLEIQTGVITLRPESLTNPVVNIRGESKIGQYMVEVYFSGPVQNPRLVLTSDPPMPESEIMLLLATGSASSQLADQQLASQKALQYLFEGLRRRNGDKDKSVLQRLIKNSDQIELSLGNTNQYSGRSFSSASLEITDQWDFTTQIDQQGQTRALLVFSVRLK